eukprot:12624876-Alexandrium_andersonii.AAC.1
MGNNPTAPDGGSGGGPDGAAATLQRSAKCASGDASRPNPEDGEGETKSKRRQVMTGPERHAGAGRFTGGRAPRDGACGPRKRVPGRRAGPEGPSFGRPRRHAGP